MNRPRILFPKDDATLWVEVDTGRALNPRGQAGYIPAGGGRKKPNLTDMLDAAHRTGAYRLMLIGTMPPPREGIRHWLYVRTPGWNPLSRWRETGAGRFERVKTDVETSETDNSDDRRGYVVEVRSASEWFGSAALDRHQAQAAWQTLRETVAALSPGKRQLGLMRSPAATGANLWAASLPRTLELIAPTDEIRDELHATSGQHHIENLTAGGHCDCGDCLPLVQPDDKGKVPAFYYVDGRFMYSAVCRELGIGGRRLTGDEARQLLFFNPRGRYARARYHVTATVPADWSHIGLLPAKHPEMMTWHYPNRPGAQLTTWADAAEIDLALNAGWNIEPHEAILFHTARPLDTFAERIRRGRELIAGNIDLDPAVQRAVMIGLRQILIAGIGNLASRGRAVEHSAATLREVPERYRHEAVQHGRRWIWTEPAEVNTASNGWYWPELSIQVWGRARARVLSAPTGVSKLRAGALHVPAHTLMGINGDALYTTELPEWSLPVALGGGDDGQPGRLRLQGGLPRPQTAPTTREQRDRLRQRAEQANLNDLVKETR